MLPQRSTSFNHNGKRTGGVAGEGGRCDWRIRRGWRSGEGARSIKSRLATDKVFSRAANQLTSRPSTSSDQMAGSGCSCIVCHATFFFPFWIFLKGPSGIHHQSHIHIDVIIHRSQIFVCAHNALESMKEKLTDESQLFIEQSSRVGRCDSADKSRKLICYKNDFNANFWPLV